MRLTTLIIGDNPRAIERTVASVRADGGDDAPVAIRAANDPAPWSGVDADAVWLLRAGDRVAPGGLQALAAGLDGHPAVVGGHRIGCTGRWDDDVLPAQDPALLVPAAICVDGTLELSALAARVDALPAAVRVAPSLPGGDVGLLCELAARTLAPLTQVVAEVRCRPEHHGDAAATLDRLVGTLAATVADDPDHARRIRRRALAVAYLDTVDGGPTIDPDRWWGPAIRAGDPDRILDLLVDVHWALGRAAEEARLLRGGFDAYIDAAPADHVVDPAMDVSDLHAHIAFVHQQLSERLATVNWLHEEVVRRDQAIAALTSGQEGMQIELARIDQSARDRFESITEMHAELVRQNEEVHRLHGEVALRDREVERLAREFGAASTALADATSALAAAQAELANRGLGTIVRKVAARVSGTNGERR